MGAPSGNFCFVSVLRFVASYRERANRRSEMSVQSNICDEDLPFPLRPLSLITSPVGCIKNGWDAANDEQQDDLKRLLR